MKTNQSMLKRIRKLENEITNNTILTLNDGDSVVIHHGEELQFGADALYGGKDNEVERIVRETASIEEPYSKLMELLGMVL